MKQFSNVKIFTDNIEKKAFEQIVTLENTGIFGDNPIRIMPDVHAGAGCVIGFTAQIKDKIIPNIVGVDIGCGMLCIELGKVDIEFEKLDKIIRENVPSGKNVGEYSKEAHDMIEKLICKEHLKNRDWLDCSLGTLGGGNHFIEIDEDEYGVKYLVIHSGSRNLGKQVSDYYQDIAIKQCRSNSSDDLIAMLKSQGREREISEELRKFKEKNPIIPKELCYLQGQSMEDYLHDMKICVNFANENRAMIAGSILYNYQKLCEFDSFTTLHNYISNDRYIRKGAICAKKGMRVLIPLNMRDGCIIGIGKGNADWNYSAPHGAGRVLSRIEARRTISVEDFTDTMKNVYSTTVDESTIDESPFAYKPSSEIIELVKDTVEIEKIIKPVYNYKASE